MIKSYEPEYEPYFSVTENGSFVYDKYIAFEAAGRIPKEFMPPVIKGHLWYPLDSDGNLKENAQWTKLTDEEAAVCCPMIEQTDQTLLLHLKLDKIIELLEKQVE